MKPLVKLSRGRQGTKLPNKTRYVLTKLIISEGITLQTLAARIGITRSQLAHPLRGGGCSPESLAKINAFMENVK